MTSSGDKHGEVVRVLSAILPLAEAYLKDAPSDPRNAHLEDARALLKGHTLMYSKSKTPKLTKREWKAVWEAIAFRIAGETDDTVDTEALRSAEDKLL